MGHPWGIHGIFDCDPMGFLVGPYGIPRDHGANFTVIEMLTKIHFNLILSNKRKQIKEISQSTVNAT